VRLGLYGGTFDPPHIGHLIVAQDALTALRLDRILFIPAAAPPHKRDRRVTDPDLRVRFLEAALADDPRFGVEPLELRRSGPSYSVDTLEALRAAYPGDDLFLLLGADQFREFRTWREPERIASLARLAVMSRGDTSDIQDREISAFGAEWVNVTRIDLSSSMIRERLARGESVRYLVPAAVEALLSQYDVYDS
jgi:nicotinate-nucleotide adenylyltransferase